MGFKDFEACRNDPDLRLVQGSPLEGLIAKSQKSSGLSFGGIQNLFRKKF